MADTLDCLHIGISRAADVSFDFPAGVGTAGVDCANAHVAVDVDFSNMDGGGPAIGTSEVDVSGVDGGGTAIGPSEVDVSGVDGGGTAIGPSEVDVSGIDSGWMSGAIEAGVNGVGSGWIAIGTS